VAATLAEQVRVRVRDEGVDPQSQAAVVRSIAESVVQAHDRRSLTGMVDPVDDVAGMVDEMMSRVSGFGALQTYLDDPSVEELWINEPCCVRYGYPKHYVRRNNSPRCDLREDLLG
jgi:pilus assembly protein CpaF